MLQVMRRLEALENSQKTSVESALEEVLVGDKDHEKVLDSIAKVDKAMRVATSRPFRARGRGRGGITHGSCSLLVMGSCLVT